MSLQRLPRALRPHGLSCAYNLPPLSHRLTISARTKIVHTPPTTRCYTAKSGRRASRMRSPFAKQKTLNYGRDQSLFAEPEEFQQRYEETISLIEKNYMSYYEEGRKHGALDPKLGPKTFLEISRRLTYQAYKNPPTAEAVKNIYPGDPARVYEVSLALLATSPWDNQIYYWAVDATRYCGVTWSLILEISRQSRRFTKMPEKSVEVEALKKVAYERDDPVALHAWANVAMLRGQKDEAYDISKYIHSITYASNDPPRTVENIAFMEILKQPWEILAEICTLEGKFQEADEYMKTGALVYRNHDALVSYAYLRKEAGDWAGYEQCMATAAVSADKQGGEACFRLGNYYYKIYKGDLQSQDELAEKDSWIRRIVSKALKLTGLGRKQEDWRKIAIHWYMLSYMSGYVPGARNMIILARETGDYDVAFKALGRLEGDKEAWESKSIKKLRESFWDVDFQPKLPEKWLEL